MNMTKQSTNTGYAEDKIFIHNVQCIDAVHHIYVFLGLHTGLIFIHSLSSTHDFIHESENQYQMTYIFTLLERHMSCRFFQHSP